MPIKIKRHEINLLLVLFYILISTFSQYPDMLSLFEGKVIHVELGILRYIKELTLLLIVVFILSENKFTIYKIYTFITLLIYCYVNIIIYNNNDFINLYVSIRPVLYVFIGFYLYNNFEKMYFKKQYFFIILFTLLVQIPFIIYQTYNLPPVFGFNFFGPRVVGTYGFSNTLAINLSALFIFFSAYYSKLFNMPNIIAVILLVVAGSRGALIMTTVYILFFLYIGSKNNIKLVYLFLILLIIPCLYQLFSMNIFSGREITENRTIFNEERFELWSSIFTNLDLSLWNIIFGVGMGFASNGITIIQGSESTNGPQIVADSMYVMCFYSFGLIGLAILIIGFFYCLRRTKGINFLIICYVILYGLIINLLEIQPAFMLLMISMAIFKRVKSDHNYCSL
jgi:hypothetical protein